MVYASSQGELDNAVAACVQMGAEKSLRVPK
jgi:hypothetical protein